MTSFQKVLASLIQLLALSGGRQKICRLIQYYCKYLSSKYADQYLTLISQRNQITTKKTKTQALMTATAMTRKVLRFGPSITFLKAIITNINMLISGKYTQQLHMLLLKTLSAIFLDLFYLCDHYIWLFRVGLVKNQNIKNKCQYLSSLGWLLDCITCLIKNICIYKAFTEQQKRNKTKPLLIDTVKILADMPVAYSFTFPGSVDGKIAGLLGTFTSAIGIYQMWP